MSAETISLLIPEIVLIAVAASIYVAGAFTDARRAWSWIAGGGILIAALSLALQSSIQHSAFSIQHSAGPLVADSLAYYARWLGLVFGGLLVLLASRPLPTPGTSEYVGSLLLAVAGLMLVAAADELVLLFVGLELVSIPTCILLCIARRDAASQESATKYLLLSIVASAILLYGFSFLYGSTGSTDLTAIGVELAGQGTAAAGFDAMVALASVLILAGLAFRIAAVPFHFCVPDVYQGTTHAIAALLSVVPKAAGLLVLVRIMVQAIAGTEAYAWQIALVLSVLTMSFGNVMALWQDHLRRLLAYSSIAHTGYLLMGLAVGLAPGVDLDGWDGVGSLLFYLCAYATATIGTFASLDYLGRHDAPVEAVEQLAGLGRTRPLTAAAVAVFMFSLAGIPPLAGFWGKLFLFGSTLSVDMVAGAEGNLRPWFVVLAVIGALNATVAAAYYLRIVAVMYFRTPLAVPQGQGGPGAWSATMVCAVLTVLIGLFPGPLLRESDHASPRTGTRAEKIRLAGAKRNTTTSACPSCLRWWPAYSDVQPLCAAAVTTACHPAAE